ncbi:site-specific tyrosine recombinase XerC [Catenovulum sediminis]|uniref:site-specific tyrosine recombinase XerC n=1 Tax=Catenovulum sediminis TaxID=1740262 RepID=UPI001C8F822A|nr:site-specific tyrosine recombinase XerC [Catenovulum sediminis]
MPKREKRFIKQVGDPTDPNGLLAFMHHYLDALRIKHYTEQTLWNNERYIRDFIEWCDGRALRQPPEITKPILERYQRHLYLYRKADGKPLSIYSQRAKLSPLKSWFKWLTKSNYLLYNPASELEPPKIRQRLPKAILSEKEVEKVMRQANSAEPLGIRDRAVMEVLYSTGIRRMEVVNLSVFDIDLERLTILVRQGKGKKDRMLPLGERAAHWISCYLNEVRPELALASDDGTLFLTRLGEKFNENWLSRTIAQYVEKSGIPKQGSCHLFRHTMATLMLENGADIRFIQAMLGHAELSTTEIYTQVSIKALKDVHTRCHPAKLKKASEAEGEDMAELQQMLEDEEDEI